MLSEQGHLVELGKAKNDLNAVLFGDEVLVTKQGLKRNMLDVVEAFLDPRELEALADQVVVLFVEVFRNVNHRASAVNASLRLDADVLGEGNAGLLVEALVLQRHRVGASTSNITDTMEVRFSTVVELAREKDVHEEVSAVEGDNSITLFISKTFSASHGDHVRLEARLDVVVERSHDRRW